MFWTNAYWAIIQSYSAHRDLWVQSVKAANMFTVLMRASCFHKHHQSFPILSSGLTSLPSPSCNHHNPIADTMLARLGNNCDNRRSVNIYYLSFISSWRWRGDAGCRRCRHWQVKRHRQSWTTALLGPSCEYTDYWYSNIHYTVLTHHGVNIQFVQDTASKYYWQSYWITFKGKLTPIDIEKRHKIITEY